jgi:hypothetical protein
MANTKVTQELIADDAIGAAQLASNAVVTASIADDAVTSAKLDTNLSVAGSLTAVGTLTANAGINVDNINIDGTTIALSSGELILDSAGDITLDAGGGDWRLKDDGATICTISNVSGDLQLLLGVADKDFKFQGTDGASQITALQLDMSAAGAATFNAGVTATTGTYSGLVTMGGIEVDQYVTHAGDTNTYMEFRTDILDLRAGNVKGLTVSGIGEVVINEDQANVDFRVESDTDANAFRVQASTGKIGIGTASPTTQITASTSANISQVAITSSSNAVAWNATAAANAYHVTTENTTFSAPSNAVEGAIISVELAQGGTVRTIAWNTVFEFAASTAPTVTATANKTDIFSFRYNGSVWQEIGRVQNLAQT